MFSDVSVNFSDVVTDEFVNSLCLRRSCRFASTDCPYGFVSDYRTFECCSTLSFQYRVDLTCTNFFSFARFVFSFGFSS